MIDKLFRPSLFRKFFVSVRDEGLGLALQKARQYSVMVFRDKGRSAVRKTHLGPVRPNQLYLSQTWQTLAEGGVFHVSKAPALTKGRRKIALIGDLKLPQCKKYRITQLAEFWRTRDVDVEYSHYEDVMRCVNILQDATHLIEYRLQTLPVSMMTRYEARRLKLPILYDLDDPLFSVSAYSVYENMKALDPGMKEHFISEAPKYLEMMNGADILSVSTPGMAAHTREYTPRPVFVRRNFADSETLESGLVAMNLAAEKGQQDGIFRVAFASGSQGHEVDFAVVQEQVTSFLNGADNRHLMILGHFNKELLPKALQGRIEMHPFTTYDAYLSQLAQADCAVMPLTDDLFNQCKSAVRVIDASSVGVPSIVGATSDMAQVVQHGETGFVADNDTGWLSALEELAADQKTAPEMGVAAREDLEKNWSGSENPHIVSPELLEWVRG